MHDNNNIIVAIEDNYIVTARCETGWIYYERDNKCYYIDIDNKASWTEANMACHNSLVSIESPEEMNFLVNKVREIKGDNSGWFNSLAFLWTSGRLGSDGETWYWMTRENGQLKGLHYVIDVIFEKTYFSESPPHYLVNIIFNIVLTYIF